MRLTKRAAFIDNVIMPNVYNANLQKISTFKTPHHSTFDAIVSKDFQLVIKYQVHKWQCIFCWHHLHHYTDENGYTLSSQDKTGGFKEIYLWLFVNVMYWSDWAIKSIIFQKINLVDYVINIDDFFTLSYTKKTKISIPWWF